MKKVLLTFVLAVVTVIAANAQIYVGGSLIGWQNKINDKNATAFTITPEVGYTINNHWGVGVMLTGQYLKSKDLLNSAAVNYDATFTAWGINPYARFTFASKGPVSLFLDGGILYGQFKNKIEPTVGDSKTYGAYNHFEIGVVPGINIQCSKHLSLVAHYGFIGYRTTEDTDNDAMNASIQEELGENGYGIDLSTYRLSFGLYYNF